MTKALDSAALATLFTDARTQNGWTDEPLPDAVLKQLYDLVAMAPTSANCEPGRYVFVRTKEGKELLAPALSEKNRPKILQAPVTVIVAMDNEFYEKLPKLFPHADARSWFTGSADMARETAFRNSSLQAAYLIMAARSLGLDTGPMSGFDKARVDAAFFAGTTWSTNMIVSLGRGDASKVMGRLPRLDFDEACRLA